MNKELQNNLIIKLADTKIPLLYYHKIKNANDAILIRISNYDTYLNTWILRIDNDPDKSLQNLSIVFNDGPCTYN